MTLQELITKYNNIDQTTLNLIAKILSWRECVSETQAAEFVPKIVSLLEKHGELQIWENVREQFVNEISRLNVERNKMKKDKENIEEALKKKKQWFSDLEKAKNELTSLEKKQETLHKEDIDMQRRYAETKKLIEELQQNHWLSPQVKTALNKIWTTLPLDELDKTLVK
ncbi:MAG: hypothetical protein LBI18_11630 [Planctomycetaceae bacterium]|jgi:chromosome segregation ATPase|nr:hypothetical protein [Planctomycetaceae bacterium]